MEKLFWIDPYQTTLTTKVAQIDGCEMVPEQTIAYAFSGGQESDKVYINDMEVVSARMDGPLIHYALPENHGLRVGQLINMTIDWPRRYQLMRLHFAAELILEIVTQKYGFEKVGAHIAAHKARIDFKLDTNISTHFDEIITAYNDIINADLLIEKGYIDEATQRRYWKIEGYAQVPCGGTHVHTTKEVGFVTLKRKRPGKSVERIEIFLCASE